MDAQVRPARAADAGFLAWCILTAGRGHLTRGWYDIALALPEPRALEALARLVTTETPSWWRFDRFLIVEVDGEPAAALAAFGSGSFAASDAAMSEALGGLGWSPAEIAEAWRRGAYVFSCTFSPADREVWTIENVAVRPEHRGKGLAGRLLRAACELGRADGFEEAQISFLIGNLAAERAYAKAGFALAEERRHAEFEAACGAPGLKRFTRRL